MNVLFMKFVTYLYIVRLSASNCAVSSAPVSGEIGEPPLAVVVPPAVRYSPGPVISVLKSVIDSAPPIEAADADKGPVDGGGGEDASLPVSLSTGPEDVSRQDLRPSCPTPMFVVVDLNEVIKEFGVVDIGGEDEFGDRSNIFFREEE